MTAHRCHDYHYLIRRWRAVCSNARLKFKQYAAIDGYKCYEIASPALKTCHGIYISAGIHGDEPGATDGLINWAEQQAEKLAELPLLIYPCLNPWGLVNNSRLDAKGNDLNRIWDHPKSSLASYIVNRIADHQFDLSLTLHEDYDGQGLYIYEPVPVKRLASWGSQLLAAAAPHLPADPRKTIDGKRASNGLIRPQALKISSNLPEAVFLHRHHSCRTYTFETPSEFSLDKRVAAQTALIDCAIELSTASKFVIDPG